MNHPDRGHKPSARPGVAPVGPAGAAASAPLDANTRAVLRVAEQLTTQVRRIADALTSPADEPPADIPMAGRRPVIYLATPCASCTHPYNWHINGPCKFGNETNLCGCDDFITDAQRPPTDSASTLDAEVPAERCDHRGPHPGFTCAEVDASQPYFRVRWEQEQQAPAAVRPPCTCAGVGFGDGSCKLHNPPAADKDACLAHRDSCCDGTTRDCAFITDTGRSNVLLVLVDRAARGVLNDHEATALRARAQQVINGRETWKAKAEEIERDRDQHAAVLGEVLAAFVHKVDGYRVPRVRAEADVVTLEKWRSLVAPTAERPWWVDVAEIRAELEELRGHLRYVLDYRGPGHDHQVEGRWDRDGSPCDHCARLAAARAALGGVEQPTTPDGSTA